MGLLSRKSVYPGNFMVNYMLEYEGKDPLEHNEPYFISSYNKTCNFVLKGDMVHLGFEEGEEYPIMDLINMELDDTISSNRIRVFLDREECINEHDREYLNSISFDESSFDKRIEDISEEAHDLLNGADIFNMGQLALADYQSILQAMDSLNLDVLRELNDIATLNGFEIRCANEKTKALIDHIIEGTQSNKEIRVLKSRVKFNKKSAKKARKRA